MSVQPPSPPSSSTSASSSPSSKTNTMQMTEAMVSTPTMADTVAPHEPNVVETADSAPGAEPAASPVVPSKKRQFMTAVTIPVKRTLRSATTTPTPTLTIPAEDADGSLSSMQFPGFAPPTPTVPEMKGQIDRWVFTEDHVAMLEASFLKTPYVSSADKALFAQTIGCGEDKVRNWFSRRRTKAKLEGAGHADQILEDEDMDVPDQEVILEQASILKKKVPAINLSAVVIPVNSAMSHSIPTNTSAAASIITPTPISTPAATSSAPLAVVQDSAAAVSKQLSTNEPQALPEKLTSTEIMKKMARILRGNAIMTPSDVETVVSLMGSAEDKVSRKYIINALMHTNAGPVVAEFASSRGPQIMRSWLMAAKSMPNDQENKEIMLRTIAVWAKLPFNYELLKEFELGKVIKSVSKDKNVDDVVVAKALQLEKHWRRQVMEEMNGTTTGDGVTSKASSSSGSKSESASNKRGFQGNGPDGDRARIKRDRDDSVFSQSSEMKLPKFNKGKPAPMPATDTKKTHIVANAGFFKELMAPVSTPSKPPPPPPSASKASSSSLSVTTGLSKLIAKPQATESTISPSKSAPSPPTTPTTPVTPIAPITPTSAASTSSQGLPPATDETMLELESVTESVPVPVAAPVVAPTAAALQAIAAAVASLTEAKSVPTLSTAATETLAATTPVATETPTVPAYKPVRPKKVVRFKAADELEMIRYFSSYNDEEEKENEEALLRGDLWRPPPMLMLACNPERGSASIEKTVQEKREAETLSVNYIREAYIPISPAEPDPDPMDATSAAAAVAASSAATTDHSAILMSSLAFLTQVASSGSTAAAPVPAITQPVVADQSQIGSYGTMYGTAGATYGTGSTGFDTEAAAGGVGSYGASGSSYGTSAPGYGIGASGYGTGTSTYGTGVGLYGTYGTGATSSYSTGVSVVQPQQQAYQYQGYQQPQQTAQAAYNPSQVYDYQQQYQQANPAAAAVTASIAPVATVAGGVTSNMDPLALIEMLKQVTGHQQQQQQQQGQYGFPQNWPNAS
ncbi:hypothetical protein BGZ96_005757 [Linnemannia gamsii]|uniref:Homeobox domain-containing protein n=1 Tax=Linnemannia gamsii TaxID=64522 RepID=A0ABQ7K590_9FUNG|nr:hypothetical protein BGZ96_005757 [Linnemannia gamsii]